MATPVAEVGATVGKGLKVDSEKNIYAKGIVPGHGYSDASHGLVATYTANGAVAELGSSDNSGATICLNGTNLAMTAAASALGTFTFVVVNENAGSAQLTMGDSLDGLGVAGTKITNADAQIGDWFRIRGEDIAVLGTADTMFVEACVGKWVVS